MQDYLNVEYFFFLIYNLLFGGEGRIGSIEEFYTSEFYTSLLSFWSALTFFATIATLLLLTLFLYSAFRLYAIRKAEDELLESAIIVPDDPGPEELSRWKKIETLFYSGGESNWRQAIIEADIMLDEMLAVQGYRGDTVGDKLKAVEPSDFNTLQYAWAAHKIRNNIAHQGQGFVLTEREAKQAMHWYERVFDEFSFD